MADYDLLLAQNTNLLYDFRILRVNTDRIKRDNLALLQDLRHKDSEILRLTKVV